MKALKRFVSEKNFHASDEKIRELFQNGINVMYGFDTYASNMKHVLELRDAIRAEYPDKADEEITVWFLQRAHTIRHAGYTTLNVSIPAEDFIKLRQENEIDIL